jgi:hypothetical protein
MQRVILLLTVMATTLVLASGVALAVTKIGTNGPTPSEGPMGTTTSQARAAMTDSSPSMAATLYWVDRARIGLIPIQLRRAVATRTFLVVPATI